MEAKKRRQKLDLKAEARSEGKAVWWPARAC